jgi:hypothetical protein
MRLVNVKSIVENSLKDYLKELDNIKLEITRVFLSMDANLTEQKDE